jgi:hypothetical protein
MRANNQQASSSKAWQTLTRDNQTAKRQERISVKPAQIRAIGESFDNLKPTYYNNTRLE